MSERATKAGATRATLFDLRLILAVLFLIYGVIVLLVGITSTSDEDLAKSGGININLWMGLSMLVVAALFGLWVWLRPIVIPPEAQENLDDHENRADHEA
jgi:hypothetical protein